MQGMNSQKNPVKKLSSSTFGVGPALLLLHGVTRCGADWEPLTGSLAARWQITLLDQRGHGASPRGAGYRVEDYVSDAVHAVRSEIASPLVILGHSLGAMVAAAVAAELPDLVRGIILEDPPFHTMGNRIEGTAWQAQFLGMRDVARGGGSIPEMIDALAAVRLPGPRGGFRLLGDIRDRASLAWSAQCLSMLDAEVLTPVVEGRWLDGYDPAAVLSRVRCPALLLQGDPVAGGALTEEDADLALRVLSSPRRVRFPGCGHQLHRDRPAEVLSAVEDFRREAAGLNAL